jgi:hypothetical protein
MNLYIITEEDICTIRDYILGAFYEGEDKEKIYNLLKSEFSVIRSRPYQSRRNKVLWSEVADLSILQDALNEDGALKELGDVWCDVPIRTRFESKMMDFAGKKVKVTITELRQQAGDRE